MKSVSFLSYQGFSLPKLRVLLSLYLLENLPPISLTGVIYSNFGYEKEENMPGKAAKIVLTEKQFKIVESVSPIRQNTHHG